MSALEAIVAVYSDWGIGANGVQPIVLPEDRRHFRRITGDSAIIVGRRTLADFPGGRPLPGRANYILSKTVREIAGAAVVRGIDEALDAVKNESRVFVAGGGSVYAALLPYTARVYVTKIDATPISDTFFPNLDEAADWVLTQRGETMRHGYIAYRFCVYERKHN